MLATPQLVHRRRPLQEKFDNLVTQGETLTRENGQLTQLVNELRSQNAVLKQQTAACTCQGSTRRSAAAPASAAAAAAPTRLQTPPPLTASSAPGPSTQPQQQQRQVQPQVQQQAQMQPAAASAPDRPLRFEVDAAVVVRHCLSKWQLCFCAVTHAVRLQDCPRLLSHIAKVAADKKIAGAVTVNQIKQNPGQLLGALSAAEWFAVYKVSMLCHPASAAALAALPGSHSYPAPLWTHVSCL